MHKHSDHRNVLFSMLCFLKFTMTLSFIGPFITPLLPAVNFMQTFCIFFIACIFSYCNRYYNTNLSLICLLEYILNLHLKIACQTEKFIREHKNRIWPPAKTKVENKAASIIKSTCNLFVLLRKKEKLLLGGLKAEQSPLNVWPGVYIYISLSTTLFLICIVYNQKISISFQTAKLLEKFYKLCKL